MNVKNVENFIHSAIKKYSKDNRIVDLLFWKEAIRLLKRKIRAEDKAEVIITESFGGTLQYNNSGMRHRDEEESFTLEKGDKVIIIRKNGE